MNTIKKIGLIILILTAIIMGTLLLLREPIPEGKSGAVAEKLAERMTDAVNKQAWDQIQWLSWSFNDKRSYIWNKSENLAVIQFGKYRVHLNLVSIRGSVWVNGVAVEDVKKNKLIEKAWSHWCHDSYWLNPIVKIRDEGAVRKAVDLQNGEKGLHVTFTKGGVSPGDSYLYVLNEDGIPAYWKMWSRALPIAGVKATFENYHTLEGGAKVALDHKIGPIHSTIHNLKVGNSYQEIGISKDPFLFIE